MTILVRTSVLKALLLLGGSVVLGAVVLLSRGTAQRPVERQDRRSDEMETRTRGVILRLKRKERLLQMHLAGWLTLLETAAHYRALDRGPPEFSWKQFRDAI